MTAAVHATCVAIGGRGVLLVGRSGSGKSDLALRLIDRGAELVSDDGTIVVARADRAIATAPLTIVGRIEVRGIGIVDMPARAEVSLALVVALDQPVPRMPDECPPTRSIAGIDLPVVALDPFENSAPVKVEKALLLYGLAP